MRVTPSTQPTADSECIQPGGHNGVYELVCDRHARAARAFSQEDIENLKMLSNSQCLKFFELGDWALALSNRIASLVGA